MPTMTSALLLPKLKTNLVKFSTQLEKDLSDPSSYYSISNLFTKWVNAYQKDLLDLKSILQILEQPNASSQLATLYTQLRSLIQNCHDRHMADLLRPFRDALYEICVNNQKIENTDADSPYCGF